LPTTGARIKQNDYYVGCRGMQLLALNQQLSKSNKNILTDLINRTESPACSLFALTNTLQPVVSRCLRGCPVAHKQKKHIFLSASVGSLYVIYTSKLALPLVKLKKKLTYITTAG
jgi:hypothetical protein